MKPNDDLLTDLYTTDGRILYLDSKLFDKNNLDLSKEKVNNKLIDIYQDDISELVQRTVAVYLSKQGLLSFSEKEKNIAEKKFGKSFFGNIKSPLKNIIALLEEGTELLENKVGDVSPLLDNTYFWYGVESANNFRNIFPEFANKIYPAIVIYNYSFLEKKASGLITPSDSELKRTCIRNVIISDL